MFYGAFEKYNFCVVSTQSIKALSENLKGTLNHFRDKMEKFKI